MDVSKAPADPQRLWGSHIDSPRLGEQTDGHALEIRDWVLGRDSSAAAVELLNDGSVVWRVSSTNLGCFIAISEGYNS